MRAFQLFLLAASLVGVHPTEPHCPQDLQGALHGVLHGVLQEVLQDVPTEECRRQMLLYMEGLLNVSDWAIAMADATGKPGAGLLRGNLRALGDMDLCLAAEAMEGAEELGLRGKFCLVSLHADTHDARLGRLLDLAMGGRRGIENIHQIIDLGDGTPVPSPGLVPELSRGELGLCVPSACSGSDVAAALRVVTSRVLAATPLSLDIHVPEHACRTRQGPQRPLGPAHYAFLMFTGVIIMLVIFGTICDIQYPNYDEQDKCIAEKTLRAFSLRKSWQQLTSEHNDGLGCICGLRTLSTMYLVLMHEVIYIPGEPSINKSEKVVKVNESFMHTPLLSGAIVVDSFFTLSGILYSYVVGNSVRDCRFFYWKQLLIRWMRMSPVYYVIIWFYYTFFEYLGDGPGWEHFINLQKKSCEDQWIFNVLYVNSYIKDLSMCVPQSWVLSADMQLAALAPLAVLPLFRWPRRRALTLMALLVAISVTATAATVIILRIPGIYRPFSKDNEIAMFLKNNHARTHVHISPYLVGLFVGYILNTVNNKEIVINKVMVSLGWLLSILIFAAVSFGPYYMLQKNHEYNVVEHAAYAALGRLLWGAAIGWVVFACHKGFGGLVHKFLDCYPLRVMSRLSYGINITHFIFILHSSGRRRVPVWMDEYTFIQTFIADYVLSALLAFVIFVTIESPLVLILKIIFIKKSLQKAEQSHSNSIERKNK